MARIYISSSWRNGAQPSLVRELREQGHKVYDFRNPCGRNESNVWKSVAPRLGLFKQYEYHSLHPEDFVKMCDDNEAVERFNEHFDAMQDADTCVLLLPAGDSSHVEAGYMKGLGKRVLVMDTRKLVRPELMYLTFDGYYHVYDELYKALSQPQYGVCRVCGCTEDNPCYHPEKGYCRWLDADHTLCSHCGSAEIVQDSRTHHCINDVGKAFQ